jgi:uncharacterized damage-inducible protein DinB
MKTLSVLATLGLLGAQAFAQSSSTTPANPLTAGSKMIYGMSKTDILKSAEEMPEENYSFKPVATVRSFGELVGHVADAQYEFCGPVVGDGAKSPGFEKNKTSKADLIDALKVGFAYCDKAYADMTDARATEMVKFFGRNLPKLSLLEFNISHNMEHYGNIVTYLRIKGLVPPSSQPSSR